MTDISGLCHTQQVVLLVANATPQTRTALLERAGFGNHNKVARWFRDLVQRGLLTLHQEGRYDTYTVTRQGELTANRLFDLGVRVKP